MVILPIGSIFGSGPRHKQIKRYVCRRTELLYRFAFSCSPSQLVLRIPLYGVRRVIRLATLVPWGFSQFLDWVFWFFFGWFFWFCSCCLCCILRFSSSRSLGYHHFFLLSFLVVALSFSSFFMSCLVPLPATFSSSPLIALCPAPRSITSDLAAYRAPHRPPL